MNEILVFYKFIVIDIFNCKIVFTINRSVYRSRHYGIRSRSRRFITFILTRCQIKPQNEVITLQFVVIKELFHIWEKKVLIKIMYLFQFNYSSQILNRMTLVRIP